MWVDGYQGSHTLRVSLTPSLRSLWIISMSPWTVPSGVGLSALRTGQQCPAFNTDMNFGSMNMNNVGQSPGAIARSRAVLYGARAVLSVTRVVHNSSRAVLNCASHSPLIRIIPCRSHQYESRPLPIQTVLQSAGLRLQGSSAKSATGRWEATIWPSVGSSRGGGGGGGSVGLWLWLPVGRGCETPWSYNMSPITDSTCERAPAAPN